MSRSTRESAAARALVARIEARATGRLSVVAGGNEVTVHILAGDVVAATLEEELALAIRMLTRQGVVTDAEAIHLEDALDSGQDVFEQLLRYGPAFDEVLRERFRQNVCEYLTSGGAPRFFEQKTILVQNIQIGHDTRELVDELCALCDQARAVDPDRIVMRGRVDTGGDRIALAAVRLLSAEPRNVAALCDELPVEPTRARALVGQWLARGILAAPFEPERAPAARTRADYDLETVEDAFEEDATRSGAGLSDRDPSPVTAPLRPGLLETPRQGAVDRSRPVTGPRPAMTERGGWSQTHQPPRADPPSRALPPPAHHTPPAAARGAPPASDFDEFEEDIEDARTEQVDMRTLARATHPEPPPRPVAPQERQSPRPAYGAGAAVPPHHPTPSSSPGSLASHLNRNHAAGDDALDAFSDNDYDRGSTASGRFSTEARNLERVEVVSIEDDDEPTTLDAGFSVEFVTDSGRTNRYSAPPLTQGEAVAKIRVANDALAVIAEAFDDVLGRSRGPMILQALVDAAPPSYASVLSLARVNDLGELPQHLLLRNLHHRPLAEHRLLLNNSLTDLVERALSVAADELPEDSFDRVLERAGTYRQRMGL